MPSCSQPSQAQRLLDFQYTDSLTQGLLDQHCYWALDSVGRAALRLGTDYPALRRRLGAGALAAGHPAAALRYYSPALHENPLDTTARYGLATAYLALNQPGPAALLAGELPDSARQRLHLVSPRVLTAIELESSTLQTAERRRGTGTYGRLGLSSRLSPRLSLRQSFSYYAQTVELPRPGSMGQVEQHRISQGQYQALLVGQLSMRWQVKAGYDFITRDLGSNHLGYLALAYARPVWTAQAGLYAGIITDTTRVQADLRLTVYPLGDLRLYGFGRGSVVGSQGRAYPNALIGVGSRLQPWLWAEAWAAAGTVPVLAEADGTYVYNLLDPLRRRATVSLLILGPRRLSLRLNYGVEERRITDLDLDYLLHSFSAALAWFW
ncbi:MAG: tetratricopeptide repeat protein [Hymenobacter sp.]|nr:MAG: tetratricopeptide repeat protein [Hymenobacter sp.]